MPNASDRPPLPAPRRIPAVLREFLQAETAGALVLLAAALVALVWASSPLKSAYESLWSTKLSLAIGDASVSEDLRHWVNEGLMAVFFFVVGLEIKRELVAGELRSWRTAALPAFAALGGMVVPAALYTAVNVGEQGARGWGIPMATDIAFALGVLALLSSRLNSSLRLFLLTLAIVDDIGAIVVIAAFYSDGIRWLPLGAAALVLLAVWLLPRPASTGCPPTPLWGWPRGSWCSPPVCTPPSPAPCSGSLPRPAPWPRRRWCGAGPRT